MIMIEMRQKWSKVAFFRSVCLVGQFICYLRNFQQLVHECRYLDMAFYAWHLGMPRQQNGCFNISRYQQLYCRKESFQLFSLLEIDRHLRKSRPSPQFIYISLKVICKMDQQSVTNCGVNFSKHCRSAFDSSLIFPSTCFHSKENSIKMIGIFRPLAVANHSTFTNRPTDFNLLDFLQDPTRVSFVIENLL